MRHGRRVGRDVLVPFLFTGAQRIVVFELEVYRPLRALHMPHASDHGHSMTEPFFFSTFFLFCSFFFFLQPLLMIVPVILHYTSSQAQLSVTVTTPVSAVNISNVLPTLLNVFCMDLPAQGSSYNSIILSAVHVC